MNYSKLKKILMLIEAATPAGYVLSQDEKDKIKQAWENRNNSFARGMIEDAWNQSSDEKKRAAIEYAESQGWDFSEMKLSTPPPVSNQQQNITPSTTPITSFTQGSAEDAIDRIKNYVRVYNELKDEQKIEIAENPNVGKIWFVEAEELLTLLANSISPTNDYIQNNKEDIAKTIFEFKKVLLNYPDVYDESFKPYFEAIGANVELEPSPSSTTTPTLTTTPPPPSSNITSNRQTKI
jgi:hypothetical protein